MLEPTRNHHTDNQLGSSDDPVIPAAEFFKDVFGDRPTGSIHLSGLRYREDLTQKELGERLGIHQSVISAMETGRRPIGKKTAKKLADFFDTDYRMFL